MAGITTSLITYWAIGYQPGFANYATYATTVTLCLLISQVGALR